MGGLGSGRWAGHIRKTTVGECHTLHLKTLRDGLDAGPGYRGWVRWTTGDRETAAIGFDVIGSRDAPAICLRYACVRGDERQPVADLVDVTFSTLCYGGRCPYFVCPGCGTRARTLHLPPGRSLFRCRTCHDLTYQSCLESHQWDALFRAITPPGMSTSALVRGLRHRYPGA